MDFVGFTPRARNMDTKLLGGMAWCGACSKLCGALCVVIRGAKEEWIDLKIQLFLFFLLRPSE